MLEPSSNPSEFDVRAELLEHLMVFADELLSQSDAARLFLKLSTLCAEQCGTEECTVALVDSCDRWQTYCFPKDKDDEVQSFEQRPNALFTYQIIIPASVHQKIEQVQEKKIETSGQTEVMSWLCFPMLHQGKLLGVFYIEKRHASFTEQQSRLINFLVIQASTQLFTLQLQESIIPRATALEASTDGVAILHHGRHIYLNSSYAKLFGYHPPELLGTLWTSLYPDTTQQQLKNKVFPMLAQLGQWRGEIVGVQSNGDPIELEVSFFLIENQKIACICRDISLYKTTERILEMTQFSVENSAFLIFWVKKDGSIHLFNQTARKKLGYSTEELASLSIWDIDIGMHAGQWPERWKELRSRDCHDIESRYINQDNEVFPVELFTNSLEFDSEPYIFIQAQDIRERKEKDHHLLRSQKLLRLVLDTIPQTVFWKDMDSVYLGCNKLFAEIAGFSSPEEIVGLDDYGLPWKPEEAELLRAYDRRVMDSDLPELGKVEVQKTADGQRAWIETNKVPLHDEQGKVIGILGTFYDITKQKQAEQQLHDINDELEQRVIERTRELQDSQNFLQLIMDTIPQSIFWKDRNSVFLGCNRNFLATVGLQSVEQVVNKKDDELRLPWQYESAWFRECDRRVMEMDEPDLQVVEPQLRANQSQGWIEISRVPLRNSDGETIGVLGAFQDVTKRKQAEQALQQLNIQLQEAKESADTANQAKSDFLASMSHELRTPLNGILGYAQILGRSSELNLKERRGITAIHDCGNHLLNLINEILEFAKIEAHKLELCPEPTHLPTLLQTVTEICRIRSEQKGIEFRQMLELGHADTVLVDEKCLQQVLLNLLGNAIKFTDQGEVVIEIQSWPHLTPDQVKVSFKVRDTGIGISKQDIEHIFRPFEQVGDPHKKVEGTGLGLAISQKIVQLMGGNIQLSSEINQGSEFYFEILLPLSDSILPHYHDSKIDNIQGYQGKERSVLILDDVPENRGFIQDILESLGFKVKVASNGKEGINCLDDFMPDLIIVDIIMPVMDGYCFISHVRQIDEFKSIPIIVSSASVSELEQRRALDSGGNYFFGKPIKVNELLSILEGELDLIWLYKEQSSELGVNANLATLQEKVVPSQDELEEVADLIRRGRVQRATDKIQSLYSQEPRYQDFLKPLESLASQFKLEEIEHVLQLYLGCESSA